MRSCKGIFFWCFLLASCARPIPPTGGDKDILPPKVVTDKSTPNMQTNFTPQEVSITFDEWVAIDKLQQTMIISPPLPHRPKVNLKGKTLTIRFDDRDTLRSNTTYIIDLSGGVKDLNEGNVIEELKYVFSTGPQIDSMQLSAMIINESDKKPAENVVVMLYSSNSDSLIYKTLPDYAARTDKTGHATLSHLAAGNYKVFALLDLNQNYFYDLTDEAAGFLPERINIPGTNSLQISIFKKESPNRISLIDSSSSSKLRLIADPSTAGWEVNSIEDHAPAQIITQEKYIDLYYPDTSGIMHFIVNKPAARPDTFKIHKNNPTANIRSFSLSDEKNYMQFIPQKPVKIVFNNILSTVDTSLIKIRASKSKKVILCTLDIDPDDHRMVLINGNWKSDSSYEATFSPGALLDIRNKRNSEPLISKFNIVNPEILGSITIQLDSLNPEYQYLIKLVKGEAIFDSWGVNKQKQFIATRTLLPADTYELLIIEDANGNSKQDAGSIDENKAPERIFKRTLEPLRENWSVEAIINMHEFD